ncbi:MAG: YbhB/YbcL family Raf kinase inhibitor-like protein [Zoogloeaceae bacterium]|nr:YbhB/YbcL family Raf kinase inhibitor-like protein [Zoogloeaceae bacterium]
MPRFFAFLPVAALALAPVAQAAGFSLTSPDLNPAKPVPVRHVFAGFGCTGENLSPALEWKNPPSGTRSFALTVYDPDAPTGSGWWHWVVVNLPPGTMSLPQGAGTPDGARLPAGSSQVRTDYGGPGYGGPCPPTGDKPHRYVMTIHALKVERLELPDNATAALAGFMIRANRLGEATMTVRYGR